MSSFSETVELLANPVINGHPNYSYNDPYAWNNARKTFGKERIEKAVREYRDRHPEFRNWRY